MPTISHISAVRVWWSVADRRRRSRAFVCDMQGEAVKLMRFVADPPTTTMQRLRGILTVRRHEPA